MPALPTLPRKAGTSLKPEHYAPLLAAAEGGVRPGWVELRPQNYFGAGGPPHRWLRAIAEHLFPLLLLLLGLATRLSALALALLVRGAGLFSIDHVLERRS